jgi:hypothetical protein
MPGAVVIAPLAFVLANMLISWQGPYGPDNTFHVGFGYDMLIVLGRSLVIYYWAIAVRLPREEVERLVALQGARMADAPPDVWH